MIVRVIRVMSDKLPNFVIKFACVSALGAATPLGWAPYSWDWLAPLAYGILVILTFKWSASISTAALATAFSFGLHIAGHGWLIESLNYEAHAPMALTAVAALMMVLYLSSFTVIPLVAWKKWCENRFGSQPSSATASTRELLKIAAVFAAAMTSGEILRSIPFNGFTGLSLGYAFTDLAPAGWYPIVGIYGVSFIAYWIACAMALIILPWHQACLHRVASMVMICLVAFGSGFFLDKVEWTRPKNNIYTYRLIQGNIAQKDKFLPQKINDQVDGYIAKITEEPADLIVTPEIALPLNASQLDSQHWRKLHAFSDESNSHVFIGMGTLTSEGKGRNSIYQISPENITTSRYDKIALMPFGEYTPFGFSWFTRHLVISMNDLVSGGLKQRPFEIKHPSANDVDTIGVLICHEDLRGDFARKFVGKADIIINPSNLAWFDSHSALQQRLQIVRARAMEMGKPILRIANTGVTAAISQKGKISNALSEGEVNELRGSVAGYSGTTPYTRWGDLPVCAIVAIILMLAARPSIQIFLRALRHRFGITILTPQKL